MLMNSIENIEDQKPKEVTEAHRAWLTKGDRTQKSEGMKQTDALETAIAILWVKLEQLERKLSVVSRRRTDDPKPQGPEKEAESFDSPLTRTISAMNRQMGKMIHKVSFITGNLDFSPVTRLRTGETQIQEGKRSHE